MTITSTESVRRIQAHAESIKCDKPQTFPEAASIGDVFRQGDIYVQLTDKIPELARIIAPQTPQLVPDSSKGSRHILDSLSGVTLYKKNSGNAITGPIIHLTEQRTIIHPEHGDVILPPGIYAITYQRSYDPLRYPDPSTYIRTLD